MTRKSILLGWDRSYLYYIGIDCNIMQSGFSINVYTDFIFGEREITDNILKIVPTNLAPIADKMITLLSDLTNKMYRQQEIK